MKRFSVVLAVGVAVLIGIGGCKARQEAAPVPQGQGEPQLGDAVSGKIVETMNSGGYTYVRLEKSGKMTWVAMPETKVKVGQEVTCQPGMTMPNFTSKTLKRTFDAVIFSPGLI